MQQSKTVRDAGTPHFSVTAVAKGAIAPPRKLRDATRREIVPTLSTQATIVSPQIRLYLMRTRKPVFAIAKRMRKATRVWPLAAWH